MKYFLAIEFDCSVSMDI